ncbi:hypothetical protein ACIP6Q_32120 [Streptomyces bobili]|uniref:hypothetical protein n=1 Tax=Streptomyces bobili TaxID=67280 RepID=UPI0038193DB7
MPDTPAVTAISDGINPTDPDDVPARQPLPGTRLFAHRVPAWGIAGPYIHMDHADIHVTYAQFTGRAGDYRPQLQASAAPFEARDSTASCEATSTFG